MIIHFGGIPSFLVVKVSLVRSGSLLFKVGLVRSWSFSLLISGSLDLLRESLLRSRSFSFPAFQVLSR